MCVGRSAAQSIVRKTLSPDGAASARDPTAPSVSADQGLVLVRGPDRPDLWDERKGWIMSVKLTDAQLVMMSAAAQRKDRCLSPPATVRGAALGKVSAKLAKLGLAREIEAKPGAPIWRRDDGGWSRRPTADWRYSSPAAEAPRRARSRLAIPRRRRDGHVLAQISPGVAAPGFDVNKSPPWPQLPQTSDGLGRDIQRKPDVLLG